MATNDTTLVNGITKTERIEGFIYWFPIATITTSTTNNLITVDLQVSPFSIRTVKFEDIPANLGASNAEEYVDALANGGYFTIPLQGSATIEDLITGELDTTKLLNPDGLGGVQWNPPSGIPQQLKLITSLDDLPTPIGGVIQLEDNSIYWPFFITLESHSNTIRFGSNCTWWTPNSTLSQFTYTGTGNAIEGGGNDVYIFGMQVALTNPSANLVSIDGQSNSKNLVLRRVSCVGGNIGSVTDIRVAFFTTCSFVTFTNGLTFSGSAIDINFDTCRFNTYSGKAIDLGTTSITDLFIQGVRFLNGSVSSYCISGLANSGNIVNRGFVTTSEFNGDGTPLENITNCDIRYKFSGNAGNVGIEDSHAEAAIYIAMGDELETTINTVGVPELVNGTWTVSSLCRFTHNGSSRLTYIGLEQLTIRVTSKSLADTSGGSNRNYVCHFRINGTIIDELSHDEVVIDGNNPGKLVVTSEITLNTNDYIELVIQNNTSTTNVTLSALNILIG